MYVPSVRLSKFGRAAHDVGMAGLLGGNLFARLALHPSVTEIRDEAERGKVVNAAWRRYGTINSLSLVAIGAGWVGARAAESSNSRLSPTERKLAYAKDALVGAVAVTGLASAAQGMRFAKQAPDGAVPLTDGDHAAPSATDQQRRHEAAAERDRPGEPRRGDRPRRRQLRARAGELPPPARAPPIPPNLKRDCPS